MRSNPRQNFREWKVENISKMKSVGSSVLTIELIKQGQHTSRTIDRVISK